MLHQGEFVDIVWHQYQAATSPGDRCVVQAKELFGSLGIFGTPVGNLHQFRYGERFEQASGKAFCQ